MKVIGAGYARTGTMSTKAALEQLGAGPCYHFVTLFERPEHAAHWRAASEGRPVDWRAMLDGYQSIVDWPASLYYRELMAAYPEAKVLLTTRDPQKWYDSVRATVYAVRHDAPPPAPGAPLGDLFRMIDAVIWEGLFHGRFLDRAYAISLFERHLQEVQDYVPREKLLIWEVKDGWAPLCAFLDEPVPEAPFPRLNDTESFRQRFMQPAHDGSAKDGQPAEQSRLGEESSVLASA